MENELLKKQSGIYNNQENKQATNVEFERNLGIDLLRILSMFFIIILHCLGQGGILNNAEINSIQYKFAWFIEICAYCAVNIFALISGYVSYTENEKKVKYSNYINMWLQIVFYGVIVTLIFDIINPSLVSKKDYFIIFCPIANNLYWYFTAYTGLFFLIPFLNNGIRNCSISTLKRLFIIILMMFSIIDTLTNNFILNNGYSFIWITLLYILGAIIKKCNIGKSLRKRQFIFYLLFLIFITYLFKIYSSNIPINLVSYTSPTILLIAILYIVYFSKLKFNDFTKKIIKFAAPSAFTVYILNNHRLVWKHIMTDLFINISNSSILNIFIFTVGFSSLFVIGSILIDKIRILLFEKIHIKDFINKIGVFLDLLLNKLENLI